MHRIHEMTAAYAAMDPWARGLILTLAIDYASRFPAPRPAAFRLSLVRTLVTQPGHHAQTLEETVDSSAPLGVCGTIGKKQL